ncbi:pyrimidine reductase family protein [Curtobacterium sp. RRHDQ10]|uniref:pyrimidine reductase family protein n=1 Tax=Curtobacterium phyllosphaerae TaxID=3413379 RepID=UPI003BF27782
MSASRIEQLSPAPAVPGPLDDDALVALYDQPDRPSWLRVNFVATADGSATADGVSGSLGGDADLRVFDLLRRIADVVLVAAGTVRAEGYGAMRLHDADVAWRRDHDLPDHPVFAILSGSLALDPTSSVFTEAPVRPIVLTRSGADPARRAALAAVADVVDCGSADDDDTVDAGVVRRVLADRGLRRVHCEGGPSLLGMLVAADEVDELCLTTSPVLEGGAGPRIATGGSSELRAMRLAHVLRSDDVLLTRYVRAR